MQNKLMTPHNKQYHYAQNMHHDALLISNNVQHQTQETNNLIKAANPLITLMSQIRYSVEQTNVSSLSALIVEEIKNFEMLLNEYDYSPKIILGSKYCLCAAIDEAVLSTSWGAKSLWAQESLLSIFHKETWGGERVYIILESMLKNTSNNIDFIELIYYLISLGFEGKFFGRENKAIREEIRHRIFYHIRQTIPKPERELAKNWRINTAIASNQNKKWHLKKITVIALSAIAFMSCYYNYQTYKYASPVIKRLSKTGKTSAVTNFIQITGLNNHEIS